MRALLVAALVAGCHHAPPARAPAQAQAQAQAQVHAQAQASTPAPTPIAVQPAAPGAHRGPGRADVDPAPPGMPLVETVSTTRPCVAPVADPQPAPTSNRRPVITPGTNGQLYLLLRGPSRCANVPVAGRGRQRMNPIAR